MFALPTHRQMRVKLLDIRGKSMLRLFHKNCHLREIYAAPASHKVPFEGNLCCACFTKTALIRKSMLRLLHTDYHLKEFYAGPASHRLPFEGNLRCAGFTQTATPTHPLLICHCSSTLSTLIHLEPSSRTSAQLN